MKAAEELKEKGNNAFMTGDDTAAVEHYNAAIKALDDGGVTAEVKNSQPYKELRRNVYSNLSNACLSLGQYDDSCRAASAALDIDPTFVKASLRFVTARMRAGYAFDAFVYALRHTRALVRGLGVNTPTGKDAAACLHDLEMTLSVALGVSKLSQGFELTDFEGGVDMICRTPFASGDVIFTEEKYVTRFDEGSINALSGDGDSTGSTTEDIVLKFAQHIRPEQQANSSEWKDFKRAFVGAWPRTVDDVDAFTRKRVGDYIRPTFADLDETAFDDLLLTSLMCRYNCFYTGFFRTCALANHSCNANIAMKYNPGTQTVTMVAVRDIAPGELMNVKYLNDAYFLLGLCKRRALLRAWLFWCRCPRCLADNDTSTAVQEFVGCPACQKYSHYPIPAPSRDDGEADPIVKANSVCAHCGEDISWPADKLQAFYDLTDSPPGGADAAEAGEWLVRKLTATRALNLHPAHWIHRVLYYLYCLNLDAAAQHRLTSMAQPRSGFSARKEAASDILQSVHLDTTYSHYLSCIRENPTVYNGEGGGANEEYAPAGVVADTVLVNNNRITHGSDALRAVRTLIVLITPFYPNSEMWALHRTICTCVLLHLLYQHALKLPKCNVLSKDQAMALLQEHGSYLGEQASTRWFHCFTLLRTSIAAEDEKDLPSVAALRKALRQQK